MKPGAFVLVVVLAAAVVSAAEPVPDITVTPIARDGQVVVSFGAVTEP